MKVAPPVKYWSAEKPIPSWVSAPPPALIAATTGFVVPDFAVVVMVIPSKSAVNGAPSLEVAISPTAMPLALPPTV